MRFASCSIGSVVQDTAEVESFKLNSLRVPSVARGITGRVGATHQTRNPSSQLSTNSLISNSPLITCSSDSSPLSRANELDAVMKALRTPRFATSVHIPAGHSMKNQWVSASTPRPVHAGFDRNRYAIVFGMRGRSEPAGVKANEPNAPFGMPTHSNGVEVPRPTLTTVDSSGQSDGYSAMDSGVGKFGDGAIFGIPRIAMGIPFAWNHDEIALCAPFQPPSPLNNRAISPRVIPCSTGTGTCPTKTSIFGAHRPGNLVSVWIGRSGRSPTCRFRRRLP